MTDQNLSQKTARTAAQLLTTDLFLVTLADGTQRSITKNEMTTYIQTVVTASVTTAVNAAVATHVAATDPHGDRAYALSLITAGKTIPSLTALTGALTATDDNYLLTDTSASDGAKKQTGDELAKAIALRKRGTMVVEIQLNDTATALTTSNTAVWRVPSVINGFNLTSVAAMAKTASTVGIPTFQIARIRSGASVNTLSTTLTIDANEADSSTAATPAVINVANDDMATADQLSITCSVAGTGTKGVVIEMQFQLP